MSFMTIYAHSMKYHHHHHHSSVYAVGIIVQTLCRTDGATEWKQQKREIVSMIIINQSVPYREFCDLSGSCQSVSRMHA